MKLNDLMSYELVEIFIDAAANNDIRLGYDIIYRVYFQMPKDFVFDVFISELENGPYEKFGELMFIYYKMLISKYPQ